MEQKYFAVHKDEPMLPKNQLIGILKDVHDRYYGNKGIKVVGVALPDRYEEGIAEGVRRAILFIENLHIEKVEWSEEQK